jgi:hypothetical protein
MKKLVITAMLLGSALLFGGCGSEPDGDKCPKGCETHVEGCDIKGNISLQSGEKIYHVPGGQYYEKTQIDPSKGERWFCLEESAVKNGWRKSKL